MATKRKKTSSRKKGRSASRFGLEILALCFLLIVAGYLGNWGDDKPKPQRPAVTTKAEKPKASKQDAREQNVKAQAEKKTSAKKAEDKSLSSDEYRLSYASDGDSFELVDAKDRKLRVRLYGVDAPEGRQSYGSKSRSHLMKLMQGQKLLVRTMYKDNYQRTVAIVYISRNGKADELSINQRQVQAGMAWVYDFYCTSSVCNTWKLEEAMAQKQKLGLWSDSNPVPPWQWRRSNPR